LSWSEFEGLVAEAYRRRGYTVEETGSGSGDGGVDLILHRNAERTLVQCKHWRNRQVGVKVVRELYGVMHDDGADKGIIVCYGDFTPEAEAFAERNAIALVNGRELEKMIAEVRSNGASRTDVATMSRLPSYNGTEDCKEGSESRFQVLGMPPIPQVFGYTSDVAASS
jgi:restriction system protein